MMFNTFVKQTEVNGGGGIRIAVYKQAFGPDGMLIAEQPHQIAIGPFDDFDQIIAENNASLQHMGYPAIDPIELALPKRLRAESHAHPPVQERMTIEAGIIAEKRAEEERQAAAAEEARVKAEIDAEKRAAVEDQRFNDRVAAAVAAQMRKA